MPRHADARIICDPHICGGEPTVAGTRIPVSAIVVQWRFYQDRARVLRAFPRLDAPSLDAALGYYEANRHEIDLLIARNEQDASSPA
ncbi:MAG: DUF433 domain-containing protein [Chloroflexi bacterium]|nr:DUF433 domain-containing protein [Chloroflexota bacterium]